MTLKQGANQKLYRIQEIQLELSIKRRLQALGLTRGTIVRVINNDRKGAMTVTFRGTRFALGRKITEHISVEGIVDE